MNKIFGGELIWLSVFAIEPGRQLDDHDAETLIIDHPTGLFQDSRGIWWCPDGPDQGIVENPLKFIDRLGQLTRHLVRVVVHPTIEALPWLGSPITTVVGHLMQTGAFWQTIRAHLPQIVAAGKGQLASWKAVAQGHADGLCGSYYQVHVRTWIDLDATDDLHAGYGCDLLRIAELSADGMVLRPFPDLNQGESDDETL